MKKTDYKKKVVVLGKGSLAIKISEWFLKNPGFDLICVVPVIPEPSWTESLSEWAMNNDVLLVESGNFKDIPGIEDSHSSIDLAVSVTYDKIIKAWFINKCKKIINIHNGPLPKYRGVSPINWALKNNEVTHGVTIHEITPGIDDGPILSQVNFSIYPKLDEVIDVYKRCLDFGWVLFIHTLPIIDEIIPRQQNHNESTYYNLSQNIDLGDRKDFTREKSRRINRGN